MIPSEQAVLIALRTQQVLADEVGVANVIDPLAGSYFVEALTNKMEEEANVYIRKLDELRRRCDGAPCWENNVMPALLDPVRAGPPEQECCDLYRQAFGTYSDPGSF